jgi:hypothetical protein
MNPFGDGDNFFIGANSRLNPDQLQPGYVSEAKNVVFDRGVIKPRPCAQAPQWARVLSGDTSSKETTPIPGTPLGMGVFSDPNGFEYALIATDNGIGEVYAVRPGTPAKRVPIQQRIGLWSDIQFIQAYHRVILLRQGADRFYFNSKDRYAAAGGSDIDTISQEIDLGRDPGLRTGARVILRSVTSIDDLPSAVYDPVDYKLDWSETFAITAFADPGGGKTTVTAAGHVFSNGDGIKISGTTNYNGTFTVSGVSGNDFDIDQAFVANDATGICYYDLVQPNRSYFYGTGTTSNDAKLYSTRAAAISQTNPIRFSSSSSANDYYLERADQTYLISERDAWAPPLWMEPEYRPAAGGTIFAINNGFKILPTEREFSDAEVSLSENSIVVSEHDLLPGEEVSIEADTGATAISYASTGPFSISAFADAGGGQITVTATGHTLVNTNTVTIINTTNYNGDYTVSNVAGDTFEITETFVTDDATGTCGIASVVTGLSNIYVYPQSDFELQLHDDQTEALSNRNPLTILKVGSGTSFIKKASASAGGFPTAQTAIYYNDRLWCAHSKDLVSASDILDLYHFRPIYDGFKINRGTDDGIIAMYPFNSDTILVFKRDSVYALNGVSTLGGLTLGNLNLQELTRRLGLVSRKAVVQAGTDILFLSAFGVMSLRQTTNNEIQSVQVPLSDPIQPLIDRIDWRLAETLATMAYFDNKLLVAVPTYESDGLSCDMVLVYDFLNQAWAGHWEGGGMKVRDFQVITQEGRTRLLFTNASNESCNVFELGNDYSDLVSMAYDSSSQRMIETREYPQTEVVTRGYSGGIPAFKMFLKCNLELSTWFPNYSISIIPDGVGEQKTLVSSKSLSRDESFKFQGTTDPANQLGEWGLPYAKDYSIIADDTDGFLIGTGLQFGKHQRFEEKRTARVKGNSAQVKINGSRGRVELIRVAVGGNQSGTSGNIDV